MSRSGSQLSSLEEQYPEMPHGSRFSMDGDSEEGQSHGRQRGWSVGGEFYRPRTKSPTGEYGGSSSTGGQELRPMSSMEVGVFR